LAIGPFQNKIEKKKIETKRQVNPYTKLEELKARNIINIEPMKIAPRRSSSLVKGANFTVSRLSLTN
jgi:chromosome segregation and condensation protein ScpB